jgi:hypothetical protein
VAVCCATAGAQAKDEKKPGDKPAPTAQPPAAKPADKPAGDKPALSAEHQAEMEAWMKAATPGPEHAKLKAVEGNWTTVTKSWHDPAGPPEESKGTREAKWIFDGRFLEERYTGSFMGTPFQGLGLAGYDNVSKKYVTAWLDNFGTGILLFTGTADAAGKSFTYTAEFTDVMTGKMTKMRTVTRIVDDKTFVFEMYGPGKDGKEFKMMEITHTKKS